MQPMKYNIRYINEIIGGTFLQLRNDDPVEHLLLDSRRLIFPDTSLFFSLKGPRRDGGVFVEELYRRGVRNFVVQEEVGGEGTKRTGRRALHGELVDETGAVYAGLADANIIRVPDTLAALQQLAGWHRRQFAIPGVARAGAAKQTQLDRRDEDSIGRHIAPRGRRDVPAY